MQTVCAHCYTNLPHRRQRSACILCSRCEWNWLEGKAATPGRPPPPWRDTPVAPPALEGQTG